MWEFNQQKKIERYRKKNWELEIIKNKNLLKFPPYKFPSQEQLYINTNPIVVFSLVFSFHSSYTLLTKYYY